MSTTPLVLPIVLALAAAPASAANQGQAPPGAIAATRYDVDVSHSSVEFLIRFMGLTNVRGRFDDYSGTIMYDGKDISRGSVSVVIKAKSIDTGVKFRDGDLRGESFFDVARYPNITFRSSRVEKRADGFIAIGDFAMHGVTTEVAIPFRLLHESMKDGWGNTRLGFVGSLTLNRKDYGINGTDFWNQAVDLRRMALGDSVKVDLSVEGTIWNLASWSFPAIDKKPGAGDTVMQAIASQGLQPALTLFDLLRQAHAGEYTLGEEQLNLVGYKLMAAGRLDDALTVFRRNAALFPNSANVYDSLGEVYTANGDREQAIRNYERALELSPENTSAMEMLRWLRQPA
jgi:polyisoprenoid-binding protein YceI